LGGVETETKGKRMFCGTHEIGVVIPMVIWRWGVRSSIWMWDH